MNCENCAYYNYDEQTDEYLCSAYMDEDEYAAYISSGYKKCPSYRPYDEYGLVRHQN